MSNKSQFPEMIFRMAATGTPERASAVNPTKQARKGIRNRRLLAPRSLKSEALRKLVGLTSQLNRAIRSAARPGANTTSRIGA